MFNSQLNYQRVPIVKQYPIVKWYIELMVHYHTLTDLWMIYGRYTYYHLMDVKGV